MNIFRYVLAAWLVFFAHSVAAQTTWPRFAGVYLQLKGGELIELANLEPFPGRDYQAFPTSVLTTLPRVKQSDIEAIVVNGNLDMFDRGELGGVFTALIRSVDEPKNFSATKGDLVISDRFLLFKHYNVEYGPQHSVYGTQTFALHAKNGGPPLGFDKMPSATGKVISVQAVYIKPAFGLNGWAFILE